MAQENVIKLEAKEKPSNLNPRQLRKQGLLPVSIYGKDVNLNVVLDMHSFNLAYKKDKEASFEISYDNKTYSTVTKNVQVNYATSETMSAEFAIVK